MSPRQKRQKLSEDGAEAVTASNEVQAAIAAAETTNSEATSKENLKNRRSLFVRSLAPTVTTDDLTEYFSQSYPIKHAVAVLDPSTKQCKGFGFVTLADEEDAQRALEEFNGSEFQGRKIRVEAAQARHREVKEDVSGHKKSVPTGAAVEAKAARQQEQKTEHQPPKLIIRNLPWSIKEPDQLAVLFRSYGKVKHATLPKKGPGLLAGFGFVIMRGKKNAEKALEAVNGKEVDGRTLAVDWAVEKDTWENLQSTTQDEEVEQASEQEADAITSGSTSSDSEDSQIDEVEADWESDEASNEEGSDMEIEGGVPIEETKKPKQDTNTLFVRNLPFTVDDDSLQDHFSQFGRVRYARIVIDQATERPRGTGFVCFFKEEDALSCLKSAPKGKPSVKSKDTSVPHSVLQNVEEDPTGQYTLEGRVLQITLAVDRSEAARLTAEGVASRFDRDKDKRRLYLLSEGTISKDSPLYQKLSPSEVTMREASAKQRKTLIESNPSLHLSLTRLSIRNIPRSITSKDLKALAREAVVGFAKDVKEGKRERLSKEEISRGGEAMIAAEKSRKKRGKGLVKQAKVVFESEAGSKVTEGTGAGRSRGYGFIEYYTHRSALMGLRWLNGHAVGYQAKEQVKGKKEAKEAVQDKKKRLIVEFAIENAQVVARRSGREEQARSRPRKSGKDEEAQEDEKSSVASGKKGVGQKRKRDQDDADDGDTKGKAGAKRQQNGKVEDKDEKEKLAKRQKIIQKKRMMRRAKKKGVPWNP